MTTGAGRPRLRDLDFRIVGVLLALTLLSLLFIFSAGYDPSSGRYVPFWERQLVWIALSAAVLLALLRIPYHRILDHAYLIYAGGMLLLLAVFLAGTVRNNARRWLDLGFMDLQPSEFMKVILIVALARYIRWRDDYKKLRGLVRPFLLTLVPMAFVLKQPDLGTALLFLPILFALLYVAGARARHLLLVMLMGALCLPVVFFGFLKEYQRDRLLVFVKPAELLTERERQDQAYHMIRSKIAVGSGGLAGRGLGQGEQRVPYNETDFLFTVVAEEWGFLGSLLVLLLYAALFTFLVAAAVATREPSGKLIIVGVLTLLGVQTAVNVGMTVGLAPITGLTLPFLSYGGSSLLSLTLAVGLVLNVRQHPSYVFKNDYGT